MGRGSVVHSSSRLSAIPPQGWGFGHEQVLFWFPAFESCACGELEGIAFILQLFYWVFFVFPIRYCKRGNDMLCIFFRGGNFLISKMSKVDLVWEPHLAAWKLVCPAGEGHSLVRVLGPKGLHSVHCNPVSNNMQRLVIFSLTYVLPA